MPYYDIVISTDGIQLSTLVIRTTYVTFYDFGEGEMKRDLFFKLSEIALHLEKGEVFTFKDFLIEEGTKEIIDFFVRTNLTEEEKLKNVVEHYLNGHMNREQFEQEIVPYRVAEKLSK